MKNKLSVIYYHEVVPKGEGYSYQKIELDKFEEQMRFLRDEGYTSLTFTDLDYDNIPNKAVIVSFDDGYRSVYENAAPIMKKYGIKGNVYLATAYIEQNSNYMNWDMVRELMEQGEFDFQAHTHNHIDIRTAQRDELQKEIDLSDGFFAEKLGHTPIAFCMPYGRYDYRSLKNLKSLERYSMYLASHNGRISERMLSSKKALPRIGISNDDSIHKFKSKLNGKYYIKGRLQLIKLMLNNLKRERIFEKEM